MPNTGRKIYIRRLVKFADSGEVLRTEDNLKDSNHVSPATDNTVCPIGGDWTYTVWVDFKVENIVYVGDNQTCDINAYFYSNSDGTMPLSVSSLEIKWKQLHEANLNNPPISVTEDMFSSICSGTMTNLSSGLPYIIVDSTTGDITDRYIYDIISTEAYGII